MILTQYFTKKSAHFSCVSWFYTVFKIFRRKGLMSQNWRKRNISIDEIKLKLINITKGVNNHLLHSVQPTEEKKMQRKKCRDRTRKPWCHAPILYHLSNPDDIQFRMSHSYMLIRLIPRVQGSILDMDIFSLYCLNDM